MIAPIDRAISKPFLEAVDSDHPRCPQHECAGDSKLSDRAAAPDGNNIALGDLRVFGSHVSSGKNVGEEEDLFIGKIALDLQRADVGKRNAHILRLSAGISTHHVRIAK